mmetsp:Transcript_22466/g.64586  ORF Transcript_22466/g.64586 Transcript_22466/m.64586 type:complete len:141 (-) Transcript_22466:720-1142(-)
MQQRIETVAASVAAPPFSSVKASALGKSYDSSRNYFPEAMVARHNQQEAATTTTATTTSSRGRSDSFHFSELSLQDDAGASTTSCQNLGLQQQQQTAARVPLVKRRSSSCIALTGLCDTIREEEGTESEGGVFEMADDDA